MSPIPLPAPDDFAIDEVTPTYPHGRHPAARYEYQRQAKGGWILWQVLPSMVGAGPTYTIMGYAATPKQVFKYYPRARPFPGDASISA